MAGRTWSVVALLAAGVAAGTATTAQAQDRTPQGSQRNRPPLRSSDQAPEKPATAPERYDPRFGYAWRKGDKQRNLTSVKATHLITFMRGGKPVHVENKTSGFELRYVDEMAQLGPGGRGVVRIERTYERVKDWATGREERRPRTVTLDFSQPHVKVIRDEQELDPIVSDLLEDTEKRDQRDFAHLFPTKPVVEIGEEWEIPPQAVTRLWLLDEEHLNAEGSRCTGRLAARRTVKGVEQVKLVLELTLQMRKLWGDELQFDPPAEMAWTLEIWGAARGEHPEEEATMQGSLEGVAKLVGKDVPPDVKVQVRTTCQGTFKSNLVAASR